MTGRSINFDPERLWIHSYFKIYTGDLFGIKNFVTEKFD